MKKTTRQRLRLKADRKFQDLKKDKRCLLCGVPAQVIHHYFHKANCLALRYCPDNGIPLCQRHHLLVHAQGDPYVGMITLKMGDKWFHKLWQARRKVVRDNIKFYEEAIDNLKI
jgi:5-methylcytosine-specific restriction endonuclease McrA